MEYQQSLMQFGNSPDLDSVSQKADIPLSQGAKNFIYCDYCGKYTKKRPSSILKMINHFCSTECYHKSTKGKTKQHLSLEHRNKIGESKIGKPRPIELRNKLSLLMKGKHTSPETEFKKGHRTTHTKLTRQKIRDQNKGKIRTEEMNERQSQIKKLLFNNPQFKQNYLKINKGIFQKGHKSTLGMFGKKHSFETKLKMSLAHSGEKCHLWKGGASREPYDFEFNNLLKEQIRKRDNYTCQKCGLHQNQLFYKTKQGLKHYKLNVHHIDYNKKNSNSENLISLCKLCHTPTNHGDRMGWATYFQNLIKQKLQSFIPIP